MNKPVLLALALSGTLTSVISHHPAPAQARSLDCHQVETLGRRYESQLLSAVNGKVAGKTHRINRRKKLRINQVKSIAFDGCRMKVNAHVTLKRKVRRDAHGTVKMKARITSFSLARGKVCYDEARVTDVSLSRTLKVGERVYKWVANMVLPNRGCYTIR
ncbi:hypothetical protein [Acaryochloris sp. IP29b_bin.148]|uniref:hypothetical protein n=1 Tax=Acaryochloris sp. IP29b_bin.148 TaxID=2969218 RepID=UPI0026131D04|nr:hypothetical protein [Acaryochloris sp. IP29b_bin.148]